MVEKSKFKIILISCSKTIIFVTFSTLVVQIMGKHIQLRYMIRLNSMYPCIFNLMYHKRILNVLREVVRSCALKLSPISYSLKRLSPNQFVSWLLVAYADGEALLWLLN